MVVAIHQPNFFPWLGYFDKIIKSDYFVFLDDVQIPKTGSSWINRVKLLTGPEPKWFTAPIFRGYSGTINVNSAVYDNKEPWRKKLMTSIQLNYKKAPFYANNIDFIESLVLNNEDNIALYNTSAINSILDLFKINRSKIFYSSNIQHTGTSNELLISVVNYFKADVYMCGGGADGYQDPALFEQAGITLRFQNFVHPVYAQRNNEAFYAGLSIIDSLMYQGVDGVSKMLGIK